jgi:AraC-like DNA-binding protein
MWEEILRIAAITSIAVVILHFYKIQGQDKKSWWVIIFSLCVISYLIVDQKDLDETLQVFIIWGAFSLSFFFWLLSKSIFDDGFRFNAWYLIPLSFQLLLHYYIFYFYNGSYVWLKFSPQLVDFGFLLLGVWEAYRTKDADLINQRIQFRNIFILSTALLIGLTLIADIIMANSEPNFLLPLVQKGSIVLLTFYCIYHEFELSSSFFIKIKQVSEVAEKRHSPEEQNIIQAIEQMLKHDKVYRKEGLSIGELSKLINEQEYKVRRAINGSMGYRNFNDFLNHHRVIEAKAMLRNPEQHKLTILEIAYHLGYSSIGPFNKAFKSATGTTPTSYRKGSD